MANASNSTSGTRLGGAEPPGDAWDDMLLVGVVARTHGNKGEVIVNATTDFADERFGVGGRLWGRAVVGVPPECLTVRAFRMHQGRPVVRFDGVASIGEAERFTGWELRVPADAAMPLPAHVYYVHDLIGCQVVTQDGRDVGAVAAVEGEVGTARLVVRGANGDVLVPLVQEYCTVDVTARRIVVAPPEGLLEVNAPSRPRREDDA